MYAIVFELVKEEAVVYLVEGFREVHYEDIGLVAILHVLGHVVGELKELGLARSALSKTVL